MQKVIYVYLALVVCLFGEQPKPRPQFSDFPAKEIYRGRPAAPQLVDKGQRTFRTMIRRGAKASVEFAGHYTVPRWGCCTSCNQFVIVDSITGTVYDVAFAVVEFPGQWFDSHDSRTSKRMEFHPDSRLIKIAACPNERDCGFYDHQMVDGKGLRLIRKELLPKQYQPE